MEPKQEAVIEGPPGIDTFQQPATQMATAAVVPQQGWAVPMTAPVSLSFSIISLISVFFVTISYPHYRHRTTESTPSYR